MSSRNPLRGEKGVSVAKILIGLAILAIVLYVGIRYILIRVHYLSIKDAVKTQVEGASVYEDDYIRREIIDKARESNVFLIEEDIRIDRVGGDKITVSLAYQDSLPLFVRTIYFDLRIEESAALPR